MCVRESAGHGSGAIYNATQQRRDRQTGHCQTGQAQRWQYRRHVRPGTNAWQRAFRRRQIGQACFHRRTGSRQGDRQDQIGRSLEKPSIPRGLFARFYTTRLPVV